MTHQTCKRGKSCIYDHPPINGWKFVAGAKAKAKPKGKGKGKGKNNDDKIPCRFYLEGNCKFGDNCTRSHTEGTIAPVTGRPKAKAKAKAKAEANTTGSQVNQ